MEKKTLHEALVQRRIHQPPKVIYPALGYLWKLLYFKKLDIHVEYKARPQDDPGPFIIIANHQSRLDYLYIAMPLLPMRLNFVVGYNEFFRSHLRGIFKLMQTIPKKNFTPDLYTIKSISRVLESGGRVAILPEGMSSISGANQPVALGSGKLFKHFRVPVYEVKIAGGYLTSTKYNLDTRPGHVDVVFEQLFTPEQLDAMTAEEIQATLNRELTHDDYVWNKQARYAFDGHGAIAEGMHTLLYRCPRCGKLLTMRGEGNRIQCTACGNGATVNEYYDLEPLDETCILPETPSAWFDMERQKAREMVREPDFSLREHVRLGMLPRYKPLTHQATSEIVGEGELCLDHTGLTYRGTANGKQVVLHAAPERLPTYGMCTDVSRFYTFFSGEFCEFYPERESVGLWLHCTEELHRYMGGEWKDLPSAETATASV